MITVAERETSFHLFENQLSVMLEQTNNHIASRISGTCSWHIGRGHNHVNQSFKIAQMRRLELRIRLVKQTSNLSGVWFILGELGHLGLRAMVLRSYPVPHYGLYDNGQSPDEFVARGRVPTLTY